MSRAKTIKKNKRTLRTPQNAGVCLVKSISPSAPVGLYRYVYHTRSAFLVVVLLLVSFLSQGVFVVYANEPVSGDDLTLPETIPLAELTENQLPQEISRVEQIDQSILTEPASEIPTAEDGEMTPLDTPISNPLPQLEEVSSTSSSSIESNEHSETETKIDDGSTDTISATSSEENLPHEIFVDDTTAASTTGGLYDEPDEMVSTTETAPVDSKEKSLIPAEEMIPEGPLLTEPVTVTHSDSGFMFSDEQCTRLATGSFYCHETVTDTLKNALFAAPDEDGDLEIFLVRDGVQQQITKNLVDDASPFFDPNSETLVWHRLIDDRYQIIIYDLTDGTEVQLTSGSTNNMEPNRQDRYVAWQRWVDTNWEVVLYDLTEHEERQLTANSAHDLAPYIHGSLVVWNRVDEGNGRTLEMYDIVADTFVTVNDSTGLSVANPRMVIMYDQLYPNGDIVTRGYDMLAKKFIALDTLPRELPQQLPESEPTSETRALIQSKPGVKADGLDLDDVPIDDGALTPNLSASTTDELTLDLSLPNDGPVLSSTTSEAVLTDYDLIIEPYAPTATSSGSVQTDSR